MLHEATPPRAMWALCFAAFAICMFGCTCEAAQSDSTEKQAKVTPSAPGSTTGLVPAAKEAEPWSDAWLLARGARYLSDAKHRRDSMLKSLRNPKNLYSRQRIAAYGHETRGWDALPEWNPRSQALRVVRDASNERLLEPAEPTTRVWDGTTPPDMEAWRALGKVIFHRYPLRADAFVEFGIQRDERMKRFGLQTDPDRRIIGVVRFIDVDGKSKVGITCALCHSSVQNGQAIDGFARRDIDYGALRLAMHKETKTPVDPELARRMATWGPGRADITEDEAEDPVTIPDLWDLRHYESLTQAGTIRHIGPVALALRQETQLLHANHQRTRPPRTLSWALAMYMYSLKPPARSADWQPPDSSLASKGKALFDEQCDRCHSNAAGGGPVVDAPKLGTDQALAFGVARGTGKYRPPNLTRVAEAAPYFHTGTVPDLPALFDPTRLRSDYQGANGRMGAITGHDIGLDWNDAQKNAMIAYLQSL